MTQPYIVFMAGGSGTRFWPASRARHPKQFLPLGDSSESLLQAAVRRVSALTSSDRIYVVTSHAHATETARQLPELPQENILAEPSGRNTAPCVGWAAAHVARRDPKGLMAVLPADPHIEDEDAYREVIGRALAACQDGALVTVGVTPTRPETGYGYLELGDEVGAGVHHVARFVEKPDEERAQQFLKAGTFLWNSGMFFFRAEAVLEEIKRQLPELSSFLRRCDVACRNGSEGELVREGYGSLPSISIDHGVMEGAQRMYVVPGAFGWYDIGSWTSAWELADHDDNGNAVPDGAVLIDARNCYARTRDGKLVALIGVEGLVVVDTEDALLILPRERAQDVRQVVAALKDRKDDTYL